MQHQTLRAIARVAAIGIAALIGASLHSAAPATASPVGDRAGSAAPSSVTGLDVSAFQHPNGQAINWSQVAAAGEDFAIVKATEGRTGNFDNAWFARDFDGAKRNGLIVGSYHFADVGTPVASDAKGEAQHYWDVIKSREGAGVLPPVLDIESAKGLSKTQLRSWVSNFLTEIKRLSGRTPIVYTYPSFWNTYLDTNSFANYPLWIAHYTSGSPTIPGGWSDYKMWQYTSSAQVNGVPSRVDRNYFNGTLAQLRSFAGGGGGTPQPAVRNGTCEKGEFCYYYNSDHQGSVSDHRPSLSDYGSSQPECYEFKGAGAGKGQCIKNNAASVWNRTGKTVRVYFNTGYRGASVAIGAGKKRNLRGTCCYNDNASHRVV